MAWYDDILSWLATTGVKILIALLIGLVAFIAWKIVCNVLVKALVTSTIKAREAVMRSKYKMSKGARKGGKHFSKISKDFTGKLKHKISDKSADIDTATDGGTEIKLDKENDESEQEVKLDIEFETIKLSDEIRQAMEERAHTIGGVIRGIGNFAIFIITGIQFLDAIGVSTTPLLTVAALFGFALALAAENVVSDFIGGAVILAENQYFHGEIVCINGYTGSVEDFTLRVTKLRAINGDLRIIPNGEIREVTNKSRVFSLAAVTVTVPYSSEEDYDKAEDCLSNLVVPQLKEDEEIVKVLFTPNITVKAFALLEESIKIRMSVKVRTGFSDTVQQKMMKLIRIEFPKKEITISSLESGMKAQDPDAGEEEEEEEDE